MFYVGWCIFLIAIISPVANPVLETLMLLAGIGFILFGTHDYGKET